MTSTPLVVGHRGWSGRFPDNTLAGLTMAMAVADMVEIDVRRSGDGKLVLSHDPEIGGRLVCESSWIALAQIDLGDGHKPALLDEALATLPDLPVQMEIKNEPGEPGYEPDHRLALETADRARQGDLVTSFNPDSLTRVKREYPEVETGLVVLFPDHLEPSVRRCLDEGHSALISHHLLVDEGLIDALDGELTLYPWTVNGETRARELAALGVTGIITDHPDLIREGLR